MTKWHEITREWSIRRFIRWLILVERSAIKNADNIRKTSDKDLENDWYEFLMEEKK